VPRRFLDRAEAGRELGGALSEYANHDDVVVLALPRGGVPVAFEVARALHAPLDVLVVRKLGVPGHAELAMGAIASGGIRVLNQEIVDSLGVSSRRLEEVAQGEERELRRREEAFRGGRPPLEPRGKTAIVVDDGLATGATMRAAVKVLRAAGARSIVVGVPVGAPETCERLSREADACVCLLQPADLSAVGMWYQDFSQTEDEEVQELLRKAEEERHRDGG
jgi:predicted phosphoribosyltransferase